jgi:hypothetical protein
MVILGFVIVVGVACVIYYLYTRKLFNDAREQTQQEQTNIIEKGEDSICRQGAQLWGSVEKTDENEDINEDENMAEVVEEEKRDTELIIETGDAPQG